MKFDEFIEYVKKNNGVDTDGYYGKQCMDLWNFYAVNVLSLTKGLTGADIAKNILKNKYVMKNMLRINNTPHFVPQKGDVAVWCGGEYGHIAICLGVGDKIYFKSLDQNWITQKLTEEKHNYTYLAPLVFLRPLNRTNIDTKTTFDVEVTADVLNVREGAGIRYRVKKYSELTENARNQIVNKCGYYANGLVKGVIATVSESIGNWGRIPSGWICLDYTRRV